MRMVAKTWLISTKHKEAVKRSIAQYSVLNKLVIDDSAII